MTRIRWCWKCLWWHEHRVLKAERNHGQWHTLRYICTRCKTQTDEDFVWCQYCAKWARKNLADCYGDQNGRKLYICSACQDLMGLEDDDHDERYWHY